jgi:LacI family transcriptional regulator
MKSGKAPGRPTILDVAKLAGVSVGTVSNVLNAQGNVSASRATLVNAAMEQLAYLPNGVAQSLRRSTSRVVGLCAPLTSSAYFAALLEIFEELAAAQGYELMQVLSHGDPALELRRVRALLSRNVDGLILIPTHDPGATLDLLAERATPTVLVDRVTGDPRFDSVAIDDRKAMLEMTAHLVALGHRSLLYLIRDERLVTTRQRVTGFRAAAAAGPVGIVSTVCQRDADDAAFARQVAAALRGPRPPTAIIASNSAIALSLLQILRALAVKWPDDVSVLVFDEPIWAPLVTPPLAVLRHPTRAIVEAAWDRLMRRLRDSATPQRRITLDAQFVAAASVAPPVTRRKRSLSRPKQ